MLIDDLGIKVNIYFIYLCLDIPWYSYFPFSGLQNQSWPGEELLVFINFILFQADDKGSLDSGVFSGEEELFAFDRTVSRMTGRQFYHKSTSDFIKIM